MATTTANEVDITARRQTRTPARAAMGGSELILGHLKAALPELTARVQIIVSRPLDVQLDTRPRILWLQDRPQDPESEPLRDPVFRRQFNALVFVSHWQQCMFHNLLGVRFSEGVVIKNAVPAIEPALPKPRPEKLRFIFTSTPYKGLRVLAEAADRLADIRQDWELHVYSSLRIYGRDEDDRRFYGVYERLKRNSCVVYHGSAPNAAIRDAVKAAHVFVYPSVFAEMCSMSVIEGLMAGCLMITSSFGSLPETCGEWAWMFQYDERADVMAARTVERMIRALDTYGDVALQRSLLQQSRYYRRFYSFESRLDEWRELLERVAEQAPAPLLRAPQRSNS